MAVVQCMMHEAGRISRNRPALIADDIRIHYGELDLMVSSTAALLRAAGIAPGNRVAVYMESGWAYVTLIFALMRAGAVVCPMNTRLPLEPLKKQLQAIECSVLIARVSDQSRDALTGFTCLDPDGLVSRELAPGREDDDALKISLDQHASIIFSSGSTGDPKAVLHSYGNHYYNAYGANLNIRLRSDDCWLLSLPLYHVGGLGIVFRCVQSGAAMATMNVKDSLPEALARFPVTRLSVVPTQLRRLMRADVPEEARKRLKAVLVGGSSVTEDLLSEARAAGYPVAFTYGLSEMNSQVTACAPTTPRAKAATSGPVLRYRQVRIAEDGEILVKGETLFEGYVEGTTIRRPVDADGWFATGDVGQLDEEGYLTVTGRKDHMFISGGENIYPEEIERALLDLPGVEQAVVVAVPDDEYGERPVAFIDGSEVGEEGHMRAALAEFLPRFKIPDRIHPWPEDAAQEDMKPDRAWFRERAREA